MSIDALIKSVTDEFGAGLLQRFIDQPLDIPRIPTGIVSVDLALGGGIPRGKITEIFGEQNSGKSSLCLMTVASAQKAHIQCAYVDTEHALDINTAVMLGVDLESLLISQPSDGTQALNIVESLIKSGEVGLIVIDSVAHLGTSQELEKDIGDAHIGGTARLLGQACRRYVGIAHANNTALVFVNQLRDNIGVMYGPKTITTGGHALRFASSIRIEVSSAGSIKDSKEQVTGKNVKVSVVKNRTAPPFKIAKYEVTYGNNYARINDLMTLATDMGIINKAGSWYSYGETRLGQGRDNMRDFLLTNNAILQEIESSVLNTISPSADSAAIAGDPESGDLSTPISKQTKRKK